MAVGNQISLMRSIACGPLWTEFESSQGTSVLLNVTLPALGPTFIAKGKVGRYFRFISRNGLILLMSTTSTDDLQYATAVRLRIAIWHRSHLRTEASVPYGLLLHAQPLQTISAQSDEAPYRAEVTALHSANAVLSLELGGERFLNVLE
jgi:hypothetical protein